MFLEEHAGLLLVGHACLAFGAVGLSTHLAVWIAPMVRGKAPRRRAIRRFALLSALFFFLSIASGLAIYPTYKVRVKTEYLENPSVLLSDKNPRTSLATNGTPTAEMRMHTAAQLVRWFDIKEHWASFGLLLAGALALVLPFVPKGEETRAIRTPLFAFALCAAAIGWFAAIVGLLVTAARSVAVY